MNYTIFFLVGVCSILIIIVFSILRKSYEPFSTYKTGIVYFITEPKRNGRFGNNVFQYCAAEILCKLYNLHGVQSIEVLPTEYESVDDGKMKKIVEAYLQGSVYPLDTSKLIVFDGYFQNSELLKHFRDGLVSLFTILNNNSINSKYTVSDIMKYKPNITIDYLPKEDLVMHLRLDDFLTHGTSAIFDPYRMKEILKSIPHRKLIIVCDTVKQEWEKEYMRHFSELNPEIVSGGLLDDWVFLKNAKRVLLSASSFAWSAVFFGNASEIYLPLNPKFNIENSFYLGCFNDRCKLYEGVPLFILK